jgi:hypothetical protein
VARFDPIVRSWTKNPRDTDLVDDRDTVSTNLAAKRSAPYTAIGPQDFDHC